MGRDTAANISRPDYRKLKTVKTLTPKHGFCKF
jgi:hypothetical protein